MSSDHSKKSSKKPAKSRGDSGTQARRRIGVGDVGAALTAVTCLMIVLGFASVRYVVRGGDSPLLKVPQAGGEPPIVPQPLTKPTPPEVRPQVLRPQAATQNGLSSTTPISHPGDAQESSLIQALEPIPLEPRTATRETPWQYR